MHSKRDFHSIFAGIGWLILSLFGLSFIVHFAWNLAAPELFGAGKMAFKNAVGLVSLVLAASWILNHAVNGHRLAGGRHAPKGE